MVIPPTQLNPFSDLPHQAQENGTGMHRRIQRDPPFRWLYSDHSLCDHAGNVIASDTRRHIHPTSQVSEKDPRFNPPHGTLIDWIEWAEQHHEWE